MRKQTLSEAKNFAVYYGRDNIDRLKGFDILVVESAAWNKNSLSMLKHKNKLVIAYLSMIEVSVDSSFFGLLNEEDFIKHNKKILVNEEYNTCLASLKSDKWKAILCEQFRNLLNEGYDGLFLDTLGDIIHFEMESRLKNELIMEASSFLLKLKTLFPDHILIQNNGLEIANYTSLYLDAICWENPPLSGKKLTRWSKSIVKYLSGLQKERDMKILALTENYTVDIVKRFAEKKGFLHYNAPKGYI